MIVSLVYYILHLPYIKHCLYYLHMQHILHISHIHRLDETLNVQHTGIKVVLLEIRDYFMIAGELTISPLPDGLLSHTQVFLYVFHM